MPRAELENFFVKTDIHQRKNFKVFFCEKLVESFFPRKQKHYKTNSFILFWRCLLYIQTRTPFAGWNLLFAFLCLPLSCLILRWKGRNYYNKLVGGIVMSEHQNIWPNLLYSISQWTVLWTWWKFILQCKFD